MSVRSDRPRQVSPEERSPTAPWWRRWILAPIALALVAIAPWFIPWPWQNTTADPAGSAGTSAPVVVRPGSEGSPAGDDGPDDMSVERLEKRIADQKESYDLPVDRSEVTGVATEPGPYVALGRLSIPRVGLDVAFGEGVFAETLELGPGHWPGTPLPGRAGNSVISGHRNTNTQPFKRIDELEPGDTITVTVGDKSRTRYTVDGTTIVPEREYRKFVLRQPGAAATRRLTIFACHPEGNPVFRIVVRATAETR